MSAGYAINSPQVSLAAGVAKTVVAAIQGAAAPFRCIEMSVSFNGINAAEVPALVELCAITTDGTGAAATPTQVRGQARTVQATGKANYGAGTDPTVVVLKSWFVPVFNGTYTVQFPLGREPDTITTTRIGLCLRVTAPAVAACRGYLEIEEG